MAFKREQVIRNAEKYVAKGKIDAGIKEYKKVLRENPNETSTLNRVGDLFARISKIDEAVRLFTQTAEQYSEDGFLVKAIAIYKKIIKLDPTRIAVYEKLAELYHKQGLVNEARTQYQVLADYYLKHDDSAAAISVYHKMTELEPENPSHHLKLAELYQQGQLWDKAMRAYRTIAELMLEHGRADEALRVFERALEVHSEDMGFITDAVLGLKDAGYPGQATELLDRAVELNPNAEKVGRLAGLGEGEPPAAMAGSEEAGVEPPPEVPVSGEVPVFEAEEEGVDIGLDDEAFVIDVDEEASESLVDPPPGMDEPGTAFTAEQEVEAVDEEAIEIEAPDFEAPDLGAPDLEAPDFEAPDFEAMELEDLDLEAPEGAPDFMAPEDAPELEVPEPEDRDLETLELEGPETEAVEPEEGLAAEDEALGFEIELEEPEVIEWGFEESPEPPEVTETEAEDAAEPEPRPAKAIDEAAIEIPEEEPPRLQDLLAEAEVFAKYGLEEKATERLGQILDQEPDHLEAMALLLDLHVKAGDEARIGSLAQRLRTAADSAGAEELWVRSREKLERAGYAVPGEVEPAAEAVEEPPKRRKERDTDDRVADLLASLGVEIPGKKGREKGPARPPSPPEEAEVQIPAVEESPEEVPTAEETPVEETVEAVDEAPPSPDVPAMEETELPTLAPTPSDEEEFDTELPGIVLPEEREAPELDDSGMDWLSEEPAAETAEDEDLFDDEDEFFDLAAELEEELDEEERKLTDDVVTQAEEPSLEEIVEGFKRGVSENLSSEDYDTHYNLGIAYREMGLIDEAIGEFQLAAKDPVHLVDCCSMLGVCFTEKGLPELAIKWYQRGLAAPDAPEETTLSLLYDMGNVYLSTGDEEAARKTFVELYGINSNYRDVVAKLEELKGEV